jgi:formyl-CoA transferase
VTRSPLLGEHTLEILKDVLHYDDSEINNIVSSGAVGEVNKS